MYPIRINDKGGKLFRKYTEDTLRTIYDTSPLGANYEVSVLIEGLVFIALLNYYTLRGQQVNYFEFVLQKKTPALGEGLRRLKAIDVFEGSVVKEIEEYKRLRNKFIHDPFKIKTMIFENHSITQSLEQLFEQGMKVLRLLSVLTTPGRPSVAEWKKRYKATIPGNTVEIKLAEVFAELTRRKSVRRKGLRDSGL